MRRRTENGARKQTERVAAEVRQAIGDRMAQALLPIMDTILAAKQDLLSFMQGMGQAAVAKVFETEVEQLVGPAGKHRQERELFRWGTARAEFTLGGRRVTVKRPRVRRRGEEGIGRGGSEVKLASVDGFQEHDPLPERVLSQILLGVSTRKYAASLEPVPEELEPHGTSKSAASRHVVALTRAKVTEHFSQKLDSVPLIALMIDGLDIAGRAVVVALGITETGEKIPLGVELGSTENAPLCTSLLRNLLDRGLKIDERVLCAIDGGRGIRRALEDVLGDLAVIQRCQVHKRRNVLRLLPPRSESYVKRALNDAYASNSADMARKRLKLLVEWLERNGHDSAAASLREGLEETLTVIKLGLTGQLRSFFATTNAIENMIGTLRRVSRNVKRWGKSDMVRRWAGVGLIVAAERFHRIKGHQQMPILVKALRGNTTKVVDGKGVAA